MLMDCMIYRPYRKRSVWKHVQTKDTRTITDLEAL